MEYCFNGNLRDYISRYRDYFLDEVHPITGELREEATFYRSPTESDTFPMSDFLSSMHADIDCEGPGGSLKRRTEPGTGAGHSKSLIKTRRLLYWSYQVTNEEFCCHGPDYSSYSVSGGQGHEVPCGPGHHPP